MKTLRVGLGVCSVLLVTAIRLCGQIAPGGNADAIHPAGPPDPQKLDAVWQVDPISDQVTINIPFTTTPEGGRGPKLPFALMYNSASTVTLQAAGTYLMAGGFQSTIFDWSTQPISGSSTAPSGPWTTTGPYIYYSVSNYPTTYNPNYPTEVTGYGCTIDGPFIYADENGSAHDMNLISTTATSGEVNLAPGCAGAQSWVYPPPGYTSFWPSSSTTDGSVIATSVINQGNQSVPQVVGPDGTIATGSFESPSGPITPATVTLTDPNGNPATLALSNGIYTATDALGRTVYTTNIPIGLTGQIPAGAYTLKTYNESGSPETYSISFSQFQIGSFSMPHPTGSEIGADVSVNSPSPGNPYNKFTAVTAIDLPDSTSYQFTYDPTYGTISMITFPTGGYVRFCWGIRDKDWVPEGQASVVSSIVVIDAFISTGGGSPGGCDPPAVGGNENRWTYAMESLDNSSVPIGLVTAPDGTFTNYVGTCSFDYTAVTVFGGKLSCKESSRAIYDSASHLKESIAQSFNSQGVPLQVATTLYDGPTPQQQLVNYVLDSYNNVTEKDESDYHSCTANPLCPGPTQSANLPAPSGGWMRSTHTQYAYSTNSAMAAAHIVNRPSQVIVADGGGNAHSLVNYAYNNFGNLTDKSECISVSGPYSSPSCSAYWQTQYTPDAYGQVTQKIDGYGTAKAATTTYQWNGPSGSGGDSGGYITQITYPNGAADKYTYSQYTGQMKTHADWNSNITAYDYSDPLNRPTSVTAPPTNDGTYGAGNAAGSGSTTYTYSDTPGSFSVQVQRTMSIVVGTKTSNTTYFDGLGRKVTTKEVTPDCSTPIEVDTAYDSMSRVFTVSNPYCKPGEATSGNTTNTYDALGRKIQIQTPDNAITTISYSGNAKEIIDPPNGNASPAHIQQVDGLGRLTTLCEVTTFPYGSFGPTSCPTNINLQSYVTSYFYDVLDNLTGVSQQVLSRSFAYDSMSRLGSATNPETGLVKYVYSTPSAACASDPSVPCSKTDARLIQVNYGYDSMNRLASKTYSGSGVDTPISCYQYDTSSQSSCPSGTPNSPNFVGRLTNAWTEPASGNCNSFSTFLALKSYLCYDPIGRPLNIQEQTCVNGTCSGPSPYQVGMSYDLAGNSTTLTNNVGPNDQTLTLTNFFDIASRPCLTTSSWTTKASPNIFQVIPGTLTPGYSPASGLQDYYLGSTSSDVFTSCGTPPASPIDVTLSYEKMFRVTRITATGQIP